MSASALASGVSLTLSVATGPPTTTTAATGEKFGPNERVAIGFDHRRLETIRAASDGTFLLHLKVPVTAIPGEHTVTARGEASGTATATFTVRTDWSTARFVPEGTGFNPYENVLSPSTVGKLELAWSALTDGELFTTPLVVNGVVYVAGQVGATGTAELYAFDAATGTLRWRTTGSGTIPSDLAVADGVLYASFLFAHTLRAYDAATGDLLWSVPGPTESPTVVEGVIYAADDLHSLWAIDAATGRKRWVAHVPLGGFGFGVAVADGIVYAGGDDADHTSPVYAYDAKSGATLWRHSTGGSVIGTPAVADGTVLVGSSTTFGSTKFFAFHSATGRVRWTASVGSEASPAVVGGGVFVGSTDHNLYAFDAKTGRQIWVASTSGNITAAQAVIAANGVVYVGSNDHSEYAFDAGTGDQLWSFQTGGLMHKQSVIDGTLYVTSTDGHLYAFRLPDAVAAA